MGVYVYSLRAKTIMLTMPSIDELGRAIERKLRANLFSYAYRMSSLWRGDLGYAGYQLTVSNTERNAENVFAKERSGVVVVADETKDLNGASVYTDLTAAQWWDTDKFPGTFAGWIERVGKSYRVVDHTPWSDIQTLIDDVWVPKRRRHLLVDGKVIEECIDIGSEADIEREVEQLQSDQL